LIAKFLSIRTPKDHTYGIILEINNNTYFAPLNSPKPTHKKYKPNPSFMYIEENEEFGIIRFNNMLPVCDEELILMDVDKLEEKYKTLVNNQNRFIQKYTEEIRKQANILYKLVVDKKDKFLSKICCNFKLLEIKCKEYKKK
jgi:protein AbiQ